MLVLAIGLFALAAMLGLYLASRVFAGILPPWPAAIVHGLFAATGLLILLYALFLSGVPAAPPAMIAAGLFVIAAIGGFIMVSFHARGHLPPKALAGIHGAAAVVAFLILCGSVFGLV